MSVNAVDLMELEPSSGPSTQRVLSPQLLRNEKMYFISKEGSVSFEFQSGEGYPGSGDNYISQSGTLYLSNFRTAYVCSPPILFDFKSFSVPLQNLKNFKLAQSWFGMGPSTFEAECLPLPNGGLRLPGILKFQFNKGGGFEFESIFKTMRSRIDGVQPSQPASEQLPVYDGVIQIPAEIPAQAAVVESATAAITSQEQQLPQPHTPPNYPEENASDQLVSLNPGGADGAVDGDDNFVLVGVDNPILTATTTTDITTTTTTAPPCDPPPQYF